MWDIETSDGNETAKCRNRIVHLLHGVVLDIGCGGEKVIPQSIGVDAFADSADIRTDLSKPFPLYMFNDDIADVVYSSHFLEHLYDYKGMLRDMARVVKPYGKIILYLPHRDYYPRIGEYGANLDHKHDFAPEDIVSALSEIGSFKIVQNETFCGDNEYSFLIVAEKLPLDGMNIVLNETPKSRPKKSVCIVRYGGFGDTLIVAPLFRYFKERGYYVCFNTTPEAKPVVLGNPYIDELLLQQKHAVPNTVLKEYNNILKQDFELFIPLHESIERSLLLEKRDPEFNLSYEERHAMCNRNYSDYMAEKAGIDARGLRPELYLVETEEKLGSIFREKNKDKFVIQWQIAGSSWHKIYPYAVEIAERLVTEYPDIKVLFTGDDSLDILITPHERIVSLLGRWSIRQSMIMTKFVDLVIGPETGVINAAGAFDTPKICLLTHSSKENLTKYFINDYSLESTAPCHPCHRLLHELTDCELDSEYELPICMSAAFQSPEVVYQTIQTVYKEWQNKRRR